MGVIGKVRGLGKLRIEGLNKPTPYPKLLKEEDYYE
jgi:hypothetical protein